MDFGVLNLQVLCLICAFCNSFLVDFRGGGGSPVQELRPVSGCWEHTLLPMPGRLHRELLPGTSGRVLTQSLPERSRLY